ncbi:MAG: MFS transporter [Candidatus Krumholzibacteriota bacterium]|nr:MFS transporter [Candidatus Krumholzibacteriota bacterium]
MTENIKSTLRDSPLMRWFILVLVSILMFATYWFQDFYSGLKPLMESQLGITSSQFGTLIGLTTIANIFGMIILGGIVLDKWGIRLTAFVFGSVAVIGGIINALGANDVFSSDPATRLRIMIVGRIFFGVGLETTCVLISRTIVKWFKGYELALAMAINMGIGRLGSALGTALSPDIANNNAPTAVTFAASLIAFGFICYIIYLIFDVRIDAQMAAAKESEDEQFKFSDLLKLVQNKSFMLIAFLCVAFYSAVFPFMQYAPDLLVNKFGFSYALPESAAQVNLFGSPMFGTIAIYLGLFLFGVCFPLVPSYIKSKNAKTSSLVIMSLLFIGFIYIFRGTFSAWIVNGPKAASLIPMGTILFTPIFGKMVDNKGKAASIMMLGAFLLIFAHITLSVLNSRILGYCGLFSLGIAFSLVPAAMWPSVAKIVPEYRLGTAYAAMFTIQNWGLGLFFKGIGTVLDWMNPEVVKEIQNIRAGLEAQGLTSVEIGKEMGLLREAHKMPIYNYTIPILMLVGLGIISIFLAYMLKRTSEKEGYGLELPSNH